MNEVAISITSFLMSRTGLGSAALCSSLTPLPRCCHGQGNTASSLRTCTLYQPSSLYLLSYPNFFNAIENSPCENTGTNSTDCLASMLLYEFIHLISVKYFCHSRSRKLLQRKFTLVALSCHVTRRGTRLSTWSLGAGDSVLHSSLPFSSLLFSSLLSSPLLFSSLLFSSLLIHFL